MTRYEFLRDLIVKEGFTSIGEIGVRDGETMKFLLTSCPITHYLGVDIDIHDDIRTQFQDDPKVRLIECNSDTAHLEVRDSSLDLVFIDGDHSYDAVMEDIENWIDKVREGGIICGHDFGNPYHPDVERAVRDYFRIHVDFVKDPTLVWYVRKK